MFKILIRNYVIKALNHCQEESDLIITELKNMYFERLKGFFFVGAPFLGFLQIVTKLYILRTVTII